MCGATDNCWATANADQADSDGEGLGDACDMCPNDAANDADADGLCADVDNCPADANAAQTDADGDLAGDACDADDDNDGIGDGADNCPFLANADQADWDADGVGNACDTDDDGDEVIDGGDACPSSAPGSVVDAKGCALADLCPCSHSIFGTWWKNHGAYVSCVADASRTFVRAGLLTALERDAIVAAAGESTCGKK